MHAAQPTRAVSVKPLARWGWVALFAGHLPATLASLSSAEPDWLRSAAMVFTQVLFVLKIVDVRWLRVPSDRRTRTALIAILVLLHGRVLISSHAIDADGSWRFVVLTSGVATLAAAAVRNGICRGHRENHVARSRARWLVERAIETGRQAYWPARFLLMIRRSSPHRAPPLAAVL